MSGAPPPRLFQRDENFAPPFSPDGPLEQVSIPFVDEPVWVVADWTDARTVLADAEHFSRGRVEFRGLDPERVEKLRAGMLLAQDPPDHTRLRRMLTGEFTVKRIKGLEPRISAIVDEHLDRMQELGPPADLVANFALAIPSLVICELLGVPYADRKDFQHRAAKVVDFTLEEDERRQVSDDSRAYMGDLVRHHRSHPGDDLLSRLILKHASSGEPDDLTEDELIGIGNLLLIAGHETTSNMLSLGTLALLRHPEQIAVFREQPAAVPGAVEELLRYLSVVHAALPRVATSEVQIGTTTLDEGDLVTVSLSAANRDRSLTEEGGELDLRRPLTNHVAFGHGIHHCLGAPLARMEMQIAFPALFRRFPRLALADEHVAYREQTFIFGLTELPVVW
ncbi:MAG: cytochrome P450 [Friedmanniella sp.]